MVVTKKRNFRVENRLTFFFEEAINILKERVCLDEGRESCSKQSIRDHAVYMPEVSYGEIWEMKLMPRV